MSHDFHITLPADWTTLAVESEYEAKRSVAEERLARARKKLAERDAQLLATIKKIEATLELHLFIRGWKAPRSWKETASWRLTREVWARMARTRRYFDRTAAAAHVRASRSIPAQIAIVDMPIEPHAPCAIAA